ncbi:transglycosylase domain-containing protein [Salinibacillus kushneri]|uniref:transglycosylase domain-containing protein n=1 Tax=Salinibacillus kushneri TaxID=237682 RepID=UPI001FDF6FA0|nr:PBP1A family penicillin-binding protein [Salinibacillus kushneri]
MIKRTQIKELWNKQHSAVKWGIMLGAITIILSILGFYLILLGGKWIVDDHGFVFSEATVIETKDGEEVATLYSENRTYVPIDQIPEHVQNAFIAIEDQRFYKHAGVDLVSVTRAVVRDLFALDKVEGASTITQQLVKNLFLTNEKSWIRKTKEVMGAIYLEREMSKPKILEYYLNEIYFGHGIYGIQKASQYYFDKNVQDLTVSEGALLAAIPKSPTNYSPLDYPENAKERRDLILATMEEIDMINAEEMSAFQGKTLGINRGNPNERPWIESYVDIVLKEMEEKYHISQSEVYRGGYTIVTGIDPTIQQIAYKRFQNDKYFNGSAKGMEGSFVLMNEESGAIVAAIGGRQFKRGDLNRVFIKRQPGSTIKPIAVYGPALETGDYTPYSMLVDEKRTYQENYTPENYNDTYEGKVSMYQALIQSKNAPAVWLLNELGIPYVKGYFDSLNIDLSDEHLSMALGGLTEGLSPLQMVKAYRSFAHQGNVVEPYAILNVEDKDGEKLASVEVEEHKVFGPQTAWDMTKMLEGVVTQGTGKSGEYSKALAGKTGTTQHPHVEGENKDAWFVGYTPDYVGAVWMGYDKTDEDHYIKSNSGAPTQLMKDILSDVDQKHSLTSQFEKPENVKNLPKPVQLPVIADLQVKKHFGFFSGVTAELTWMPSQDKRVLYRIYEKTESGSTLIGEVEGQGTFQDQEAKMFDNKSYFVVPYNPLTKQSGKKSNIVSSE